MRQTCVLKGGVTFNSPASADIFLHQPNAHDSAHQQDCYNNRHYDGSIWRGLSLQKKISFIFFFLFFFRKDWFSGSVRLGFDWDDWVLLGPRSNFLCAWNWPANVNEGNRWCRSSSGPSPSSLAGSLPHTGRLGSSGSFGRKKEHRGVLCNLALPGCVW